MCGIIGVVGKPGNNVVPKTIEGLYRLEYRGYDSVGLAAVTPSNRLEVRKAAGRLGRVERILGMRSIVAWCAVGHTRWATHGPPTDYNAHPHTDCRNTLAVVHNGIIKNFMELRSYLSERGHELRSDTDTELIAHLIEEFLSKGMDLLAALKETVKLLEGSYALAVVYVGSPDRIYFAKRESPLVIGLGDGENFLASDIPAFLEHANRVIILEDGEVGWITADGVHIEKVDGRPVDARSRVKVIEWSAEMASKGGYPHYMLKEIHEQPRSLRDTYFGMLSVKEVAKASEMLLSGRRIYVTAAGTSYHAALVFDYVMNSVSGIPVIPFISSEYKKYSKVIRSDDVLVAISQSGETIDTLKAVRLFKQCGGKVIAVSNVLGSAIPRESDLTLYTRAGPEIGVAATKTFLAQVMVLTYLAAKVALYGGAVSESEYNDLVNSLSEAPRLVEDSINRTEGYIRDLASYLVKSGHKDLYYLGRGLGYPLALEGALKLKEVAYLHAEAYPAGESKHGPIALVREGYPVLFVVTSDTRDEIIGNMQEMKARGALVMALSRSDVGVRETSGVLIEVPAASSLLLEPFSLVPPLQLLAYYASVKQGHDPDRPRNLAKTVTVE